ncbi:PepSY domain-containing protein [Bacillus timonensis]|nr:PepSY domain-containing protein [Bacillus timonensis]
MSWKKFIFGVAVGFAGALLMKETLATQPISAEKALKLVKESFKKHGPISGSWIHMQPENYTKHNVPYTVYKGGITRHLNGNLTQYEFFVDSKTGVIIDILAI